MKPVTDKAIKLPGLAAHSAPPIVLSTDEMRLVYAYRKLNNKTQPKVISIVEAWLNLPEVVRYTAPILRLIVGGTA